MPTEKEQNGNQEEKQFDSPAPIKQTENNTQPPDSKTNNIDNKKQPKFWSKLTIAEIIPILLFLANIGMLIAFIIFSSKQYDNTIETLAKTDTTNAITRESLEFAERTALASDSSTQHSLAIADSSLVIAFKNLQLSEKNAKIELRAYLSIVDIYFSQFVVGEEIEIQMKLQNLGKTPATQIERAGGTRVARKTKPKDIPVTRIKISDPVIQESDIKNIKKHIVLETSIGATLTKRVNIVTRRTLSQSDSIGIKSGDVIFFIFGEISYRDIFEEIHTLLYAYRYLATEGIFVNYNIKD